MKIERSWLRIIVAVIVGGIAGLALYLAYTLLFIRGWTGSTAFQRWHFFVSFAVAFVPGPIIATVLVHMLTPKVMLDGHTRCGKCGYILKGLTEPRCSECGDRI